jgi:CO/xanthine dehydrogenase Mo-binding subunit
MRCEHGHPHLHAALLRSPVAHGRIASLDANAALAMRGVRANVTATDVGVVPRIPLRLLPLPGTERFLQPVIAADCLRDIGEPVAVVLADGPALAEDGVGVIALDIEELPSVPDRRSGGQPRRQCFGLVRGDAEPVAALARPGPAPGSSASGQTINRTFGLTSKDLKFADDEVNAGERWLPRPPRFRSAMPN